MNGQYLGRAARVQHDLEMRLKVIPLMGFGPGCSHPPSKTGYFHAEAMGSAMVTWTIAPLIAMGLGPVQTGDEPRYYSHGVGVGMVGQLGLAMIRVNP